MAALTYVRTLGYVATMLGEDVELLEAIVCNDDNLTYGAIISVYTGPDEAITALTDEGAEELGDCLRVRRLPPQPNPESRVVGKSGSFSYDIRGCHLLKKKK